MAYPKAIADLALTVWFGMTERFGSRRPAPRATLLVVLLAATVVLATILAWEAHDASRSHQVTAERALRDYAAVAARELAAEARKRREERLGAAFAAVTSIAASPYEALAAPTTLAEDAAPLLQCATAGRADSTPSTPFLFRLDLRDRSIAVDPAPSGNDASLLTWLRDSIPGYVRTSYRPDARAAVVGAPTRRQTDQLVFAVRFAQHRAPIAVYGAVTCAEQAVVADLAGVALNHPLLPAAVTGGVPNDSLFAVGVYGPRGDTAYRSAQAAAELPRGRVALDGLDGWTADVALRPAAGERLLVGRPLRSRLPMLLGLLALTAALSAVALHQLRREHELARLRADFTSSVSHELRTPLSQILLFAETLSLSRARSDDERRLAADTIVQEARRLMHLVENVLHFSRQRRVESGRATADAEIDVGAELEATAAGFAPLAAVSNVRIATHVSGTPIARGDAQAVRQIVLNLLDNAVKHGGTGRTVTLSAEAATGQVRIAVEDEGPGLPAVERERIWLPYVRLAANGNGTSPGSGIGLAVVRDLVAEMRGRAWVEDAPGGGARFVVELPSV